MMPRNPYQAASWKTATRVVAKVRVPCRRVISAGGVHRDEPGGTKPGGRALLIHCSAVPRLLYKEGKQAVKMTRLSCHRFRSNQVRLGLSVLAYNLGNLWRRLALPKRIENWSLTSLQQRLVKTGGRLVKHARYYWLLLAEGHLNRRWFGAMLRSIARLPVPAG